MQIRAPLEPAGLSAEQRELLASLLEKEGFEVRGNAIPRRGDVRQVPLSFGQQRLWLLDHMYPGNPAYNIPAVYRLKGCLNVVALEQTLSEIVRRHESLRTIFGVMDEQPAQIIRDHRPISLPVFDFTGMPESERESEARRIAAEEAGRPFDLKQGPLFRAILLRIDEDQHVLVLTMHHAVSDGWSLGLLLEEVQSIYTTYSAGLPSPLSELSIQYADFSLWQRQWLQGDILQRQVDYWKKRLTGISTASKLITGRQRPAVQTFNGAKQSGSLPKALGESLKVLSRREKATLFMTLLAAFQVLLHRYTGEDDLLLGTPIANRNRSEIEGLIGFFVNTLVLRADLSGDPTFREFLRRVRAVALEAYSNQDLPFERLVEEVAPPRDLSQNPIVQITFSLQNSPVEVRDFAGLILSHMDIERPATRFDLQVYVWDTAEGLLIWFLYNTDLFDSDTISRMRAHYQALLEGIIGNPEQRLSNLPILSETERRRLLIEWNSTQANYAADETLHALFEAQVRLAPNAVALVFEDEELTYGELNRRANQLAHCLVKLGVGPERPVGLCVERSIEMVVGLLGILKAGGAYVPLDPLLPRDRLAFILEDTAASVVVTKQHLVPSLPTSDATTVILDSAWQTISEFPVDNLDSAVTCENLVYILFTSGSTGKPKGVAVEHRQLTNYVHGILERLNLPTGSSFATVSTFAADLGNTAIFPSLCSGGILHVLSQERAWDSASLIDYFEQHPVDCLKIVPSHLQALLSCSRPAQVLPRKCLVLGGEPLSFGLAERIQELAPDTVVLNHYGPTETTVGVITYRLSKAEPRRSTTVPIGRPLPNTQIYLLDKNLQPVPVCVPGEIYVAGSGLARGYLNRPDLTTEKFVISPLGDHAGVRLYKTGDRARYLPDGNLEFLGRVDNQVKIRGFRVELGEIEAVLRQHPGVNDGVVIARDDVPGDRRLIAYVVPNHLQLTRASDLREFFKKRLPDYMQPSAFVMLEALPLTPNGKVNRQALPAPDQSRPDDLKEAFVPASQPAEKTIAEIWAQVLHLDRVGIHDNFFDLGGHSLLLMQVHSRILSLFDKSLPLIKMFEHSTVYSLARYLTESDNEDALSGEDQKQHQRLEDRKTRLQQIRDRIKREQLNEQL